MMCVPEDVQMRITVHDPFLFYILWSEYAQMHH
ncbi:Uncharacterised protein [Chlamydia trachomatis]|nr:Uncharacterised protein [Chlamydia trachomatis]